MKLVMAIIHDEDASLLMKNLIDDDFSVTKLSSTGGFLKAGNTTLLIGTNKERVDEVIKMIELSCKTRNEVVSSSPIMGENSFVSMPMEVHVGGATVFVIDVESHFKF
jgi:uncharacterized protein YaaQ